MSSERGCERSRTLIVHKDDAGYGLTLSGDKPTRVQTVKPAGASDRAGVREGDVIIKVNGQQVTDSSHGEVVKLIQTGSYVALTVVHSSRFTNIGGGGDPSTVQDGRRGSVRISGDITGPSPANNMAAERLMSDKMHYLQLMIEQQSRVVEDLRSNLARTNSKKTKNKLDAALKNLQDLEAQKSSSSNQNTDRVPSLPSSPSSPFSQLPPVAPPRSESMTVPGLPPQLPPRNKVDSPGSADSAPAPPPRPPNSSLPPPPPKTSFHRYHSNESLHPCDTPGRRDSHPAPPSPGPKVYHERTRSSPILQMQEIAKQIFNTIGEPSGQKSPRYETPPGTPPPPYIPPELITWGSVGGADGVSGSDIIGMESDSDNMDEDGADEGLHQEGDHGPFNSLTELMETKAQAHLSVFLNYVLSNDNASPLLFYLITDAYKSCNDKEMKKWAFEIHSSFLVPGSPLELPHLDGKIIDKIDTDLSDENSDQLKNVFWKVRRMTTGMLKRQLNDFRVTRTTGLGNIYGPADSELKMCFENVDRRMSVIHERLVPVLEPWAEDMENSTDKTSTLCSSLATVMLKTFSTKDPKTLSIIEKIPTFLLKEKKRDKIKIIKDKLKIRGHHFEKKYFDQVTECNHSHIRIWGIGPQGYTCPNCGFNVYKKYVTQVEEECVGSQDKKKSRIFHVVPGLSKMDRFLSDSTNHLGTDNHLSNKKPSVSPSPSFTPRDKFPPTPNEEIIDSVDTPDHRSTSMVSDKFSQVLPGSGTNSPKTGGIRRSESAKDGASEGSRRNQRRGGVRKHSDPYQRQSRLSYDGSGSAVTQSENSSSNSSNIDLTQTPCDPSPFMLPKLLPRQDSDIDSDQADQQGWRNRLTADQLASISQKEQKRQDVINELFHTEKSHVRNIKTLERVFRRPLLESGLMPKVLVERLFPNLDDVIQIHSSYNNAMRNLSKGGFPIKEIGELLSDMFLGSFGDSLIKVGAEFTKNQESTIQELKRIRQKDSQIELKLQELEMDPDCRRLQLHDMLAWEHQRLVKYPLLLEQITKYSEDHDSEIDLIKEAAVRTRVIVDSIDKLVAEAQNKRKLEEVQRNLDTSQLDKSGQDNQNFAQIIQDYRNIDLTNQKLLYDGHLKLKLGSDTKGKSIELYVLLLDDCVMFLQKQDDKYILKFHTSDVNKKLSPIVKFSTMIVRPVATNKRAFYLINSSNDKMGAQMYELHASSTDERSKWLTHINKAAEVFTKTTKIRPTISASNISFVQSKQQIFESGNMDMTDRRGTGRSQSFNEQSLRTRELLSRPLPSPPIEKEVETLERKIEKLSKKDEEVARALEEKQKIIADIFSIPPEDYETITDLVVGQENRKDAKDVLLAVMAQADCLARCVNECLKVSDESEQPQQEAAAAAPVPDRGVRLATPPSDKLVTITNNMNTNLTALLAILQEQEEEKQKWRRELIASQDQVRAYVTGNSDSQSFRSRPESFISLESDITSEHDKSENIEVEDNFGPNSSTPLKDSTPTNDVLGEHLCNINEEEMIQVEEPQVVHIGEIVEEKDIVESSDC